MTIEIEAVELLGVIYKEFPKEYLICLQKATIARQEKIIEDLRASVSEKTE